MMGLELCVNLDVCRGSGGIWQQRVIKLENWECVLAQHKHTDNTWSAAGCQIIMQLTGRDLHGHNVPAIFSKTWVNDGILSTGQCDSNRLRPSLVVGTSPYMRISLWSLMERVRWHSVGKIESSSWQTCFVATVLAACLWQFSEMMAPGSFGGSLGNKGEWRECFYLNRHGLFDKCERLPLLCLLSK